MSEKTLEIICEDSDYYNLEVKQSTIPDAGNGVFTTAPFSEGDIICVYRGRIGKNFGKSSDKVLTIDKDISIDGYNIGSLINDIIEVKHYSKEDIVKKLLFAQKFDKLDLEYNCKFTKKGNVVLITATKDILAGEELFISYGYQYWFTWFSERGYFGLTAKELTNL